ncbi:MAG: stress response translation initiation inhibitor YciH [Candidatus Diapherotrites archaeon]|nr:stress response translation initiation inhibitor YciH [Candidatus Diapherotrites archaeon]
MDEICEICGLPKNLCVCKEMSKDQQKINIKLVNRRFKKTITLVSGFENEKEAKEFGKELKRTLACGGTVKDKIIELQGNHKKKVKDFLIKKGFKEELIND